MSVRRGARRKARASPPLLDGTVVWFTGLPSSGKSTLARRVSSRLRAAGRESVLLDGDAVRAALVPAPGYDAAGRDDFYATLARLAATLARDGHLVLVAATASRRAHRELARGLSPRFVEVWLDVPAEECARRDPKGLWARARAGGAPQLPGAGAPYQTPERPEVTARGGEDQGAVEEILRLLERPVRPARKAERRPRVSTEARRPGSRSRR